MMAVLPGVRKMRKRKYCRKPGILLALALPIAAQTGRYELANNRILLALDGEGRVTELDNRQTGHSYITAPGQAPWRMYYRRGTPVDGALDLEIDPARQKCRVRQERGALVISCQTLTGGLPRNGQTRDLRVSLEVRVTLDQDRLIWTGQSPTMRRTPSLRSPNLAALALRDRRLGLGPDCGYVVLARAGRPAYPGSVH